MKIAVTYENGQIFQHFGHTAQFKLYEVEDGKVVREAVVDTNGSGHGALAGLLAQSGVDTLICGGIDFALTALFVVLFIEQVIKRENRPAGFMGLACSVAGLAVFGADNMVIPAMVLTLIALLLGRKKLCA